MHDTLAVPQRLKLIKLFALILLSLDLTEFTMHGQLIEKDKNRNYIGTTETNQHCDEKVNSMINQ